MNEPLTIDRAKRRKGGKRRRRHPGCHKIRRRMGKSGVRTLLICPGKPARMVKG